MITFPDINPVAFSIGPIELHWYGLMYLFAFLFGWLLGNWRARSNPNWDSEQVTDLVFYCALGAILGGRVGYVLFYDFFSFVGDPLLLFRMWEGGMSFHGGLLGVIIAMMLFARKTNKTFFMVSDFVAPLVPLGLGFGRIGNFINGELWGRVTDVPWGMVYPHVGVLARHPSALYQALIEGVVFFLIVWIYSSKPRPERAVSGLFALCYGGFRLITELFREPDAHIGFLWGSVTMGQLLSVPLMLVGIFFLYQAYSVKHK